VSRSAGWRRRPTGPKQSHLSEGKTALYPQRCSCSASDSLEARAKGLKETIPQGFEFLVKEARKELTQNFGCYKNTIVYVLDRGMTTEGKRFWDEKGNLAVRSALEEAERFMMKDSEACKESANLKALKANRDRLIDLIR
jgi:hypothetical protein